MECKCGCGSTVARGKEYISGHNLIGLTKTLEHNRKIGEAQKKAWQEKRERMPVGSKNTDHYGYVRVKVYEGAGEWRKEHILVMEQALGRLIAVNESVHHINGVREDNRIENLQLCRSRSEHKQIEDSCKTLVLEMFNKGQVIFDRRELRYKVASRWNKVVLQ